jgi:hypothetical protein
MVWTMKTIFYYVNHHYRKSWAGVAQSVWRRATDWTARGSNPGGGDVFLHPSRPAMGPTQPPYIIDTGLFPEVKRPRRGVDIPIKR